MGRSLFQITYIHKGSTMDTKIWAVTAEDARDILMGRNEFNMKKFRIVKTRKVEES